MLLLFVLLLKAVLLHSAPAATATLCEGCTEPPKKGIHVFRVALSSKPEEVGGLVRTKLKKKYGSNVYAPHGDDTDLIIRRNNELLDNIPAGIDPRVKDRVSNSDFIMKPVDPSDTTIWVPEKEPLPNNFQPFRPTSSTTSIPFLRDPRLPILLTVLLVIAGILLGMLCSIGLYAACSYSRKPVIDRSQMIVYRRPSEAELAMLEQHRKMAIERQKRYAQRTMNRHSSQQSNASSRTPRAPPRRVRRGDMSRTISRDSREPLDTRKDSG